MALNKVVLIGAGNVATHLGKALQKTGCDVLQVYSRTKASASELAETLSVASTTSLEEIRPDASLYVVALKDAVLQQLIPQLVKGKPDAVFVHTAGSMPMQVWEGHARRYGVLYPMQTFSKRREVDFSEVPFFVEADGEETLQELKELAGRLSPNVREATSEQRRSGTTSRAFRLMRVAEDVIPYYGTLVLIGVKCREKRRIWLSICAAGKHQVFFMMTEPTHSLTCSQASAQDSKHSKISR